MAKLIIYTAIFGGYDALPDITATDEEIDYYCFTDSIPPETNRWNCIHTVPFFKDNKLNTNYVKINPHLFFPWDSIALWIDSNIEKVNYSRSEIFGMLQDNVIATLPHRFRTSVYGEASIVSEQGLDNKNKVAKWESELRTLGYPDTMGLAELGFLIRDLRQPTVRNFNAAWWSIYINGSRRDQLSFNPAIWLCGLTYSPVKIEIEDSKREGNFHFPFKEHRNSSSRILRNSFPAHDVTTFAPNCWVEFIPSKNKSDLTQKHFLFQQELWTEKTLVALKELNFILQTSNAEISDNYCFVKKIIPHTYTPIDIRHGWKREYLRKCILPSRWGIEVGFHHGHSAAIMLGYNPNLSLISIEASADEIKKRCAEKMLSLFPTKLEVHFEKPATAFVSLSQKLPLEKVEFVHYNVPDKFEPEDFWATLEWYLCSAPLGCRLILSDMTHEINSIVNIVYNLALIDYLDPEVPAIGGSRQLIKSVHMDSLQFEEIKSWHITPEEEGADATSSRKKNVSLRKQNELLAQQNLALENEIQSLKNKYRLRILLVNLAKKIKDVLKRWL